MTHRKIAFVVAMAAFFASSCSGLSAQHKTSPHAMSLDLFLERLDEEKTSFGKFRFLAGPEVKGNSELKGWAAQLLATNYSFLGRPNDAIREFPIHDQTKAPLGLPDTAGFVAVPASDWIADQAGAYGVIMVNEAHHKPQTRLLTLSLLPRLRRLGFSYLAVEALGENPLKAGYPTADTGYYTSEPVFAELVREASRLGYTLVPYEADKNASDTSQQARETGQAKRLADVIAKDPNARIIVHAGYGHIQERAASQPADADPMALEFMRLTRLSVLTIDQTRLTWEDGLAARRLAEEFAIKAPSVLVDRASGNAWTAFPGTFDASVVLPAVDASKLRPDWLDLGGIRRAVSVDLVPCLGHLPCLVEARPVDEGDDAIPSDQFLMLAASEASTPLYLAPGKYRLRLVGANGGTLVERTMQVPSPGATPPSARTP